MWGRYNLTRYIILYIYICSMYNILYRIQGLGFIFQPLLQVVTSRLSSCPMAFLSEIWNLAKCPLFLGPFWTSHKNKKTCPGSSYIHGTVNDLINMDKGGEMTLLIGVITPGSPWKTTPCFFCIYHHLWNNGFSVSSSKNVPPKNWRHVTFVWLKPAISCYK